jgi:hypothetical protein
MNSTNNRLHSLHPTTLQWWKESIVHSVFSGNIRFCAFLPIFRGVIMFDSEKEVRGLPPCCSRDPDRYFCHKEFQNMNRVSAEKSKKNDTFFPPRYNVQGLGGP